MSEFVIVCGLMGCGKSTFAKEFAERSGYKYIDFDKEYHDKIGAKHYPHAVAPEEDVPEFIEVVSKVLNRNAQKSFIIDNWFKWKRFWWREPTDNTLQELKSRTDHEIRVIYLFMSFKTTVKRYREKHRKAGTERDMDNYYPMTMKERQENMLKKIGVAMRG